MLESFGMAMRAGEAAQSELLADVLDAARSSAGVSGDNFIEFGANHALILTNLFTIATAGRAIASSSLRKERGSRHVRAAFLWQRAASETEFPDEIADRCHDDRHDADFLGTHLGHPPSHRRADLVHSQSRAVGEYRHVGEHE